MPRTGDKTFGELGRKTTNAMPHYPDHPRRCQARHNKGYTHLKWEDRPKKCAKWAAKGERFCRAHMGPRVRARVADVSRPYRKLGKSLLDKLEHLEEDGAEALQLRNELNLHRAVADEAVGLYSIALDMKSDAERELVSDSSSAVAKAKLEMARKLHDAAAEVMGKALKEVRDACLDAARVEAMTAGKFSPEGVKTIIFKMMRILEDTLPADQQHLVSVFEAAVREQVRLPSDGTEGTTVTPDQDVGDMDSTIPRA